MTLDRLIADIRKKAEQEAQRILDEAGRAEKQLLAETRKRLKEEEQALRTQTEEQLRQLRAQAALTTKLKAREALMQARTEAIDRVYEEAVAILLKNKEAFYRRLMAAAKKQITLGRVAMNPRDCAMAKKLFKGLPVDTIETRGGFILTSTDGRERIDYRLETLVDAMKERTIRQVSDALFPAQ